MDFHLKSKTERRKNNRKAAAIRQVQERKKEQKENSRQTESNSNINKWICWRETTSSLKKCNSKWKRDTARTGINSTSEIWIAWQCTLRQSFSEKVSFLFEFDKREREKEQASVFARARTTKTLIRPIVVFSHTIEWITRLREHDIFAIFTVFMGHSNTTKIGNNFKFYCYVCHPFFIRYRIRAAITWKFILRFSLRLCNFFFLHFGRRQRPISFAFLTNCVCVCVCWLLIRLLVVLVVMNFLFLWLWVFFSSTTFQTTRQQMIMSVNATVCHRVFMRCTLAHEIYVPIQRRNCLQSTFNHINTFDRSPYCMS